MTYWVMGIKNNAIHMMADTRASGYRKVEENSVGTYLESCDVSQKIFFASYLKNKKIYNIGICIGGFASGGSFTAANLIETYLNVCKVNRIPFKDAEAVLIDLTSCIRSVKEFMKYYKNNNCSDIIFGVGLYNGSQDKATLATGVFSNNKNNNRITSHPSYAEMPSRILFLAKICGDYLFKLYLQQNLDPFEEILKQYEGNVRELFGNVIFHASLNNEGISKDKCDYVVFCNKLLAFNVYSKKDLRYTKPDNLDTERTLRIGTSTRPIFRMNQQYNQNFFNFTNDKNVEIFKNNNDDKDVENKKIISYDENLINKLKN